MGQVLRDNQIVPGCVFGGMYGFLEIGASFSMSELYVTRRTSFRVEEEEDEEEDEEEEVAAGMRGGEVGIPFLEV